MQWELLKILERCDICDDVVVNLHNGPVGCCESGKEEVKTLHKGSVGVDKNLRVL